MFLWTKVQMKNGLL